MPKAPDEELRRLKVRLSDNIVRFRTAKGFSQADLARILKKKQQYISTLERAEWNPTLRTMVALACALDVKTHELLQGYKRDRVKK
jgi:transcriptional regulator with XRE-family HTH domain